MKRITLLLLLLLGAYTSSFGQASICENAVSITLPYVTTDHTSNYSNTYFGSPGSSCNAYISFLDGNDVVYAYTATFNGSINLVLSTDDLYVGLFVYGSCADIGQTCLAGVTNHEVIFNTPISIADFPVVEGNTYYFVISNAAPVESIGYTLNVAANTCMNPTVTYEIVSDCGETDQFLVTLDIDDLGTAESLSIADDQGNQQLITEPGIVTFGPYPNETLVQFTLYNDQDPNCTITSMPKTQLVCAPENDFCANALDLATVTSPLSASTATATNQNVPVCAFNIQSPDVYFSMNVPPGATFSIKEIESDYESIISIFIGDCEDSLFLTCLDYGERSYIFTNGFEEDKTFYWIQDGYNGQKGNFTLEWFLTDCEMPSIGFYPMAKCQGGAQQFAATVDIYGMGSASALTITDNMGTEPLVVTEPGTYEYGLYDNFTEVMLTAVNNDDANCFVNSQTVVQYYCPPCTQASIDFSTQLDCENTQGFFINANIYSMGSSAAITVSDNQGSPSQNVTETGIYQFGPYPAFSNVTFTVSADDDANCIFVNEVQGYVACPPANDSCSDAIALIPTGDLESASIQTTSSGATLSPELPIPSCGNDLFSIFAKDIWYTVEVPASGSLTIQTTGSSQPAFGVLTNSVLQLYTGNCDDLTPVVCDDNGGEDNFAIITLSDRTPGEILMVRVFGFYGSSGTFTIAAYDASLSNPVFASTGLASYPNPVRDVLNLSAPNEIITQVTVFNILGQQLSTQSLHASHHQVDLSTLSKGTYLVKVATTDGVKTLKVIKE